MKIMVYNVYRGGENRFSFIKKIIKSENPDFLAILEACDWKKTSRFQEIAKLLKIPRKQIVYAVSNKRSASGRIYDIALYSKFPIIKYKILKNKKNIWHSLPIITIKTKLKINIMVGHFSPQSEDWRLKEVKKINELSKKYAQEPMIFMGDLNSLSPTDPYPASLITKLKKYDITKFGNPPRFDVIIRLIKSGWIDTLTLNKKVNKLTITVTEESEDRDHLDLRLDYIMVNKFLLSKIRKSYIIDNRISRKASDHFPVVSEIRF